MQHDHQIRLFSPVPAGTEAGFVGISEGDRILERDQLEAPLEYARKNAFLQKQPVRIRNQRQPGHLGGELCKDLVAPVTYGYLPQLRMTRRGSNFGSTGVLRLNSFCMVRS